MVMGWGGGGAVCGIWEEGEAESERKSERDTKEKKKSLNDNRSGQPGLGRRGPKRVRG